MRAVNNSSALMAHWRLEAFTAAPVCSTSGSSHTYFSSPPVLWRSCSRRHAHECRHQSYGVPRRLLVPKSTSKWKTRARSKGASTTLQETAALDQLIDLLLSARSSDELGKLVAENLLSFDQRFWIRLATRNDVAPSPADKKRIGDLATTTMRMVDALVKKSESYISDSTSLLQNILAAAADERGEWQVPLSEEKQEAMRQVMVANVKSLDESLLANAYAWMRKSSEDKLDGMVALLQKVLQTYASLALSQGDSAEGDDAILSEVLAEDEGKWAALLAAEQETGKITKDSFLTAVRRKMETLVLSLPSGSYAQRVQAEYLKELEGRAESVLKDT